MVPPAILSSTTMLPCVCSIYARTYGNPEPTPRINFFMSWVALVVPNAKAFSFSFMPGPWSAKRIVLPWLRMLIVGSTKYA